MLRSLSELFGYDMTAVDGKAGKVDDFYFDGLSWVIRYVVMDTGSWLTGRKVLVAPEALEQPDWEFRRIPSRLSQKQIEQSPSVELDKPVSRQKEEEVLRHFGWNFYWNMADPFFPGHAVRTIPVLRELEKEQAQKAPEHDPHLRSADEVMGYHIAAVDDDIGHLADLIIEDEFWLVRYLVVDTKNWLPFSKKVLVSLDWVEGVIYDKQRIKVSVTREKIENSPEYDPSTPVNRAYEIRLYDFHGRPKYWL
ncbi:MAG: PRC-barrel domain containing protein [Acidobacteria bacterium]|nr:PRC-barrel domain containing protein [Acidobacteriota bacterium]